MKGQTWKRERRSAVLGALCAVLAGCAGAPDEGLPDSHQGTLDLTPISCDPPNYDGCCDPTVYDECHTKSLQAADGVVVNFKYYTGKLASSFPPRQQAIAECPVERGFFLIGGGGVNTDGRVALYGSVPVEFGSRDYNGGKWMVASSPLSGLPSYGLRAYAVGIQVFDSRHQWQDLNASISHYETFSSAGNQVSAYATVAANQLLVGGGFGVASGEGAHPVDAYAHGMLGGQWQVNGKAFAGGSVQIYSEAVGLARCLPVQSPVVCFGHRQIIEGTSASSFSLNAALADNYHPEYAPVGVGAISTSWSRPLWGMVPWGTADTTNAPFGGGIAYTTDPAHVSGSVTAQVMVVGL